jgi:hypothetical protein
MRKTRRESIKFKVNELDNIFVNADYASSSGFACCEGVLVLWDKHQGDNVVDIVDYMGHSDRNNLIAIHGSEGNVHFIWKRGVPSSYKEGGCFQTTTGDSWNIATSIVASKKEMRRIRLKDERRILCQSYHENLDEVIRRENLDDLEYQTLMEGRAQNEAAAEKELKEYYEVQARMKAEADDAEKEARAFEEAMQDKESTA